MSNCYKIEKKQGFLSPVPGLKYLWLSPGNSLVLSWGSDMRLIKKQTNLKLI